MRNKGYPPFTKLLNEHLEALQAEGVPLYQIAAEIGVHPNSLDTWRKGTSAPELENFLRVCDVLKWPFPPALRPQPRQRLADAAGDENRWFRQFPFDLGSLAPGVAPA